MSARKHTISVLVQNKFGVLSRISGLFSGRGYNICSLTVNQTNDPAISKMTIVTEGDDAVLEQIDKQLKKLIDVISVTDLTGSEFVERELLLIKVKTKDAEERAEVIQLTELFKGQVVTVNHGELGIEIQGRAAKIDNFISLIEKFEIVEFARSGRVAVSRTEGASSVI
ncbi:MAG: acetolactate synthase small subunit [Victivallales bacterium]|jgi:acetolactate synthase-1/3 small subunit|nr:acetolactate synthase small subunit [Victivallales bacterium]